MQTGVAQALAFARSTEPRPAISRRAISIDVVLAVVATAVALAAGSAPARPLGPLLVALTTAPLALRRVFPLTVFWTIMAAIVAAYYPENNATLVTFIAVAFAAYSAVVHSRYRGAALLSMPLATVLVIALFADTAPPIPARATPLLIFIPIMIVGNAVHQWARRAGDSGARLRQAQAEHEAATRHALALERARLASELHDVVTHNVSIMVVQAGAARRVLSADPAEATKALRAVESSGRTAMTELRHLLGLLTPPPGAADADEPAGQPGRVAGRCEQPGRCGRPGPAARSGRAARDGRPGRERRAARRAAHHRDTAGPAAGLGLGVYRVVQEALTNVIKHAGKPRTEVRLNYEPAVLVVEVADDGRPIPSLVRHRTPAFSAVLGWGCLACGNGSRSTAATSPPDRGRAEAGWCRQGSRWNRPRCPRRCQRKRPAMSEAATAGAPLRVVIADDQTLVRSGFRLILKEAGITVAAEAANGTEAVAAVLQHRPDVVLMDIRMPGMDGLEATRRILASKPGCGCRIIILTTFDLDQYVYAALTAGASGFLLKDTSPNSSSPRCAWSARATRCSRRPSPAA